MNYYPNFNNQYYMQDLQNMRDRIDQQIRQMQQPQQVQQPANITQNFQIAPNGQTKNDVQSKIVKDEAEVKSIFVLNLGLFADSEFKNLWVKDESGKIRTFTLSEVIELSESEKEVLELKKQKEIDDQTINYLKNEIENMKGMILNAKSVDANADGSATKQKSSKTEK